MNERDWLAKRFEQHSAHLLDVGIEHRNECVEVVRLALVNGAAGAVVAPYGQLFSVMAFTVANGKITQLAVLLDPERLAQLDLDTAGIDRDRSPKARRRQPSRGA